ncbi:MAG TPA: hypothetical protein VHX38_02955 [Pseudonocardiaceae bacterium]|jgi:hypothetical protein|nr:hypothetical protein [Pseudonocardiaceae bacterium]
MSTGSAAKRFAQGKRNLDDAIALLPTPKASDTNGPGTHGTGGPDMRTVVHLLPTPAARDWKSSASNQHGKNSRPLNEVAALLPTPTVADADGTRAARGGAGSDELLLTGIARQVWSGEPTDPPSDAGSSSSVDLHRHPSLWDDVEDAS